MPIIKRSLQKQEKNLRTLRIQKKLASKIRGQEITRTFIGRNNGIDQNYFLVVSKTSNSTVDLYICSYLSFSSFNRTQFLQTLS